MKLGEGKTRIKKATIRNALTFFINHRKEVITTLSIHRLGLPSAQAAEELSLFLPSWVIPHMGKSPTGQEPACGKSEIEMFANALFLTYHEGSALKYPKLHSQSD